MGKMLDRHQTEIQVNKETKWLTDRWIKGQLVGQTDGWADRYTEIQMDRQTD